MPRYHPYTLQLQITRMFEQGQSFFAQIKVQDWLKEHNQDPANYDIFFHEKPAPPGSGLVKVVEVELRRKDGQPVESWLQQELGSTRDGSIT
ncbi:MAG TPA: hypothetical protein V6C46_02385 [Coleofasciculaceae cyanobacterium]